MTGLVDSNATTPTVPLSKMFWQDVSAEAHAIHLRIRFVDRGNPPNLIKAEIYGAWVEYLPAQEPHV
jgi:hypothetical protein